MVVYRLTRQQIIGNEEKKHEIHLFKDFRTAEKYLYKTWLKTELQEDNALKEYGTTLYHVKGTLLSYAIEAVTVYE